jgi:hypothetical protein
MREIRSTMALLGAAEKIPVVVILHRGAIGGHEEIVTVVNMAGEIVDRAGLLLDMVPEEGCFSFKENPQ